MTYIVSQILYRLSVFIGCIFIFSICSVKAQKNRLLPTVLSDFETKYEIRFSYNPEWFDIEEVNGTVAEKSLDDFLAFLADKYTLVIEKVNERYYVLKRKHLKFQGFLKVLDTKETVPFATIMVKNKTLFSELDGSFELNAYVGDTIHVKALGFEDLDIPVAPNDFPKTFYLSNKKIALKTVFIQQYLGKGFQQHKDGAIDIRPNDQDLLSGLGEPDVLQSLQLLPGIESIDENAGDLNIRGGTPDQNLVLWEGIKLYSTSHFFGAISSLNPYAIGQVNVYKQNVHPKFGNGVSGVVDISAKEVKKTEVNLGLNAISGDVSISTPLTKKAAILVSYRSSLNAVYNTPFLDNLVQKNIQNLHKNIDKNSPSENLEAITDVVFDDVLVKATVNLHKQHHLRIAGLQTITTLNNQFQLQNHPFINDDLSVSNKGISLEWEGNFGKHLTSNFKYYKSIYDLKYKGTNELVVFDAEVEKTNHITEDVVTWNLGVQLNSKLKYSGGIEWNKNIVDYQFVNNSNFGDSPLHNLFPSSVTTGDHLTNISWINYHAFNYSFHKKWLASVGSRLSKHTTFTKFLPEPRLAVNYTPSKFFKGIFSYELRKQNISQVAEFKTQNFGLENKIWVLSSSNNVPLLDSRQWNLGFTLSKKKLDVNLNMYVKNIRGISTFTNGVSSSISNLISGKSTAYGFDVLIKKRIKKYTTWLTYAYTTIQFRFPGINNGNPFKGNNEIAHSLNWSQSYRLKNWQFSSGWKVRTGKNYTPVIGVDTNNDSPIFINGAINSLRLPFYQRLDVSVNYVKDFTLKNKVINTNLGISVQNLLDRKNVLDRDYILNPNDNISIQELDKLGLFRSLNFFVRLRI